MFQPRSIQSSMSFREKVYSLDYILVFSILILGLISMFAMYSPSVEYIANILTIPKIKILVTKI